MSTEKTLLCDQSRWSYEKVKKNIFSIMAYIKGNKPDEKYGRRKKPSQMTNIGTIVMLKN